MESTKTVIPVNPELKISYKEPIAKDFTLHVHYNNQIVTFALFSEAEGIAILNALAKAGANVVTDEEIKQKDNKQHSTLSRKTRLSRRRSTGTWLRTPRDGEETAVWYLNEEGEEDDDTVFDDEVEDESVTDGGFSSYFGTLPKATKRLFKSELSLYKSDSNLRLDKIKFSLAENWRDEEIFDPGQFGLLDDPGVLRLDFDDYPDSVYDHVVDSIPDYHRGEQEWIRKSYEELDLDLNRGDCSYLAQDDPHKVMSQSTGDITESVNNDYFEYVRNRFETELPDYEEAVNQSRASIWNSQQSFGQEPLITFRIEDEALVETGDISDNSTIKFSESDGETEV